MDNLDLKTIIPAKTALELFNDWLDSEAHSSFTGGEAHISPEIGSKHDAWDGYIWGEILELTKGERILMTWTTSEFPDDAKPSVVELLFKDVEGGCEIQLIQTDIPAGQGVQYKSGWNDHYFQPMADFYLN